MLFSYIITTHFFDRIEELILEFRTAPFAFQGTVYCSVF